MLLVYCYSNDSGDDVFCAREESAGTEPVSAGTEPGELTMKTLGDAVQAASGPTALTADIDISQQKSVTQQSDISVSDAQEMIGDAEDKASGTAGTGDDQIAGGVVGEESGVMSANISQPVIFNAVVSVGPPASFLQDSISGAKKLPRAAFTILRHPYNTIRRREPATESRPESPAAPAVAASDDQQLPPGPDPADQAGLVSRTLDSISSLPSSLVDLSSSLFISGPSPPCSATDKSPSHVRTFLFQPFERLVSRPKTDVMDTDTQTHTDADTGKYTATHGHRHRQTHSHTWTQTQVNTQPHTDTDTGKHTATHGHRHR